jgi:hypothetical protein
MADYTPVALPGTAYTFQASGTITGGDLVGMTGALTVNKISSLASLAYVGVAGQDAAIGQKVTVYVDKAIHESIADGTVTAGDQLTSTNTANRQVKTLIPTAVDVGASPTQGSINTAINTNKAPEVVNPGAEYPRSPATPGPAAVASVSKWGQDVPVTDEHIGRYGRRAVDVALIKIVNYIVRQVDSVCLAAISAAVTQNAAATGGSNWSGASADPLLDLMLAKAAVTAQDQGYDADTAVMSDTNYARLIANSKVIAGLNRESDTSVTITGDQLTIAGLRILATNNLPVASTCFVLDSAMLGGIGYERIPSPEYTGDPASGVESWSRRDPNANDQWIVRGRRPVVPVVQEPNAAFKITGLT